MAALAGIAALLVIVFGTVPRGRVVDGYVLFVGAAVLLALVHATRLAGSTSGPSSFERALRRRARSPDRPSELERIEREVVLGTSSAFDLHVRVRPLLREIAAHRLASRRGVDLDTGTDDVQHALGADLWELLRPDREPPDERFGPGLPLDRLREALDRLERI